ncbi:hypothetical protein [Parapedobacter koreensis]|uniref:LTXXQ motif family protein n=1 Tax=Parapedobacter koreensis TaxID=332977 RepID=A0A1H7INB5_9SPHI|nr:hypothetical protein [Parapedobacter koreensis]SEK63908.1 hypothetical protein SAMN05421740_102303 [Parapedobacter koreensis]
MNIRKTKKALATATGTIAFLVLCTTAAQAQEQDSVAVNRVALIADDLEINPDQAKAVMAIIDLDKTKARELVRETYQQLSLKLQALAGERDQALKEVLSIDQLAKIQQVLRREDLWSPDGRPVLEPKH